MFLLNPAKAIKIIYKIECKELSPINSRSGGSWPSWMIRTSVPSSPCCWVGSSGTGWQTDRSDLLPSPLRRPSCNRWLTARRRAEGATRSSTSRLRRPLPSRCPIRPPLRSSVPAPLSRWTSCRRRPSPSCSSPSSAFSWPRRLTWPPATVVSGFRKPMLLRINRCVAW